MPKIVSARKTIRFLYGCPVTLDKLHNFKIIVRRPTQTISKILIFPVEFAATNVDDWPRQQTEEINCAASSISWPESGSLLLNL
ncbi:hypothetical protein OIU79_021108 [Salix purpurea]|uniref:Uncharacterized protein n=1 Tax=Salix purpurea TaxID=77065 RepID=A0A9Q1AGN0_SALPP|nr:hypothetical protein OIU79_021108 [Salix purpurea]